MSVFVVVFTVDEGMGMFNHDIGGAFTSLDKAIERATNWPDNQCIDSSQVQEWVNDIFICSRYSSIGVNHE